MSDISEEKKHFCLIPWTHLHPWPNGEVYLCCASDFSKPSLGKISDTVTLEDIWNSPTMKKIRIEMLEDRPVEQCKRCYKLEEEGITSMRQEHNKTFAHHLSKIDTTIQNGEVSEINMPYMDIRFSNLCNFRCRICGPDLSSAWFKDAQALNMPMKQAKALLYPTEDPEILWKQVESLLPKVELIYFAGGEPLIMDEHYRILKWLSDHKRFDVKLRYNTNFSNTTYNGLDVFELWKNFKHVEVGASLDSFGKRAEFARKETNWAQIELNRKRMMEICPNAYFFVSSTLSIFNFTTMPEFHRDWVDRGLIDINDWNINPLIDPRHYSALITTWKQRKAVIGSYQMHIDWIKEHPHTTPLVVARWEAAIGFLEGKQIEEEIENFKRITLEIDKLREESFVDVFPELSYLIEHY